MQFLAYFPSIGLFPFNVAVASIVVGLTAIVAGMVVRRSALPLRHGLLCTALALTLASPLLVWIASNRGVGIVPISLGSTLDSDSLMPMTQSIAEVSSPVQSHELLEPSQGNAESSGASERSAGELAPALAPATSVRAVSNVTLSKHLPWSSVETISRVGVLLFLVWAAVALWFVVRLVRGLSAIRQLRRSLRPTTDPRLIQAAIQALPMTGRQKHMPLYESQLAPAPLTLGCWRPVIVMPEGLAKLLNDEQLTCVLAHERAHVARHDTAIALLQQLAGIGFWWNPLLRAVNRQIDELRERICDDHVVKQFGNGRPLAEAIVKVVEWSAAVDVRLPLATTLLDDFDSIEQRITRLAERDRSLSVRLSAWSAALVGLFGIMLAAVSLVPAVRAQTAESAKTSAPPQQAGWQVRIRTVDVEGKPIANARIGVQLGGSNEPRWQNADRDGLLTETFATRAPRYCYLFALADGYAPMRAFWRNSEEKSDDPLPSEFTFEMRQAIPVGGIVVDENNKPIAGATVLFSAGDHQSNPSKRAEISFYGEKLTTDGEGRWRCNLAAKTINSASINVSHPDYAVVPHSYSLDKRIPELFELKHSWTLKKGFAITGRVVDVEGNPVAGATLAIGELNLYPDKGPFQHTDLDGRYRFERVSPQHDVPTDDDPRRFTISMVKSGFMPMMESVPGFGKRPLDDSKKEERVVNFTVRRGVKLTLHVVDSQNRPIQGAWVIPDNWRDTTALGVLRQFGIPTETDEKGIWRWNDAPPAESIGYDVLKSGFADVRDHNITVNDAHVEHTIVLKQPQMIVGTVIDAMTRQPIPEFIVERAFEGVADHADGLYWASDATRGKNGTYRKPVTMPPHNGSYTYRVLAEGYKTAISKSTPFTEGETTVNFELQAKQPAKPKEPTALIQVQGRAKDLAGKPVTGATVFLVSTNGIDKQLGETKTDSEGRYEFHEVQLPLTQPAQLARGGTFQVYGEAADFGLAWHGMRHYLPQPRPGYSPKVDDESAYYQGESIEMDLTFRPAAKLIGTVKDEKGRPVADARIQLSSLDYLDNEGHEWHHNYREFWAMYSLPPRYHEARTGADGRFEINGLPADTAGYVIVEHSSFATQTFFAAITDKPLTEYHFIGTTSISIANGSQVRTPQWETRKVRTSPLEIRVDSTERFVMNVIHEDDGTPAKDTRVSAFSGNAAVGTSASQQTDERGRVEFALPPGKYRFNADPPRDTSYVRTKGEFEVRAGSQQQTDTVRLKAGCVLILETVNAVDGSPIPGVSYWCDDDGKLSRRVGVQSSTAYVDNPVTNDKGELRVVVLPGTRHYGVGWSPLPNGYRSNPNSDKQLIECPGGKTVRVRFELRK